MSSQPNYQAWDWDYRAFPAKSSMREKVTFFLKAGILAPSLHNTQPWSFSVKENTAILLPDWSRQLHHMDPRGHHLLLSIGCCITNIEVAATAHGYAVIVSVTHNENKKPIIHLNFSETTKTNIQLRQLAPYITKRYSNKFVYTSKGIPHHIITDIAHMTINTTKAFALDDKNIIQHAAFYQREAVVAEARHPLFLKELGTWLKPNNFKGFDGMPGFVVGLSQPASVIGKFVIPKLPPVAKLLGEKDYEAMCSSSAVGLIAQKGDDDKAYIDSGRLYERVILYLTSKGVSSTPMHSISYYSKAQQFLSHSFKYNDLEPRFFFRFGFSDVKPYHTPRRPIEQVLAASNTEQALTEIISTHITIQHVQIGKHKINYAVAGKGKPLLLIHGGNIGWGQWYPNIAALAKHFKIYAIDLPGAGRSSRINFASMDLQKDLVDVVDDCIKQFNLKHPHVVASSIGGWVAMNIALRRPHVIDKLVLADAIGFTNRLKIPDRIIGIRPLATFMAKTMLKPVRSNKNLEMFMRDVFYDSDFPFPREFIEYFYETMATSHNLLFINRLSGFWGIPKELYMAAQLPNLQNETLILWGQYDKLTAPDVVQPTTKLIPHKQFIVIKNAGHIASIEKSKEFNTLVIDFLMKT